MSDDARFTVTIGGEVVIRFEPAQAPDPEPSPEDRHKAKILAEGAGFDDGVADLFARGIAVGRNGGDVEAFLREQFAQIRREAGNA